MEWIVVGSTSCSLPGNAIIGSSWLVDPKTVNFYAAIKRSSKKRIRSSRLEIHECQMKRTAFMLAMVLGALIWVASPIFTGHKEPWDENGPYYLIALVSAGVVVGWLEPRCSWLWPVAIYLGQFATIIVLMWATPPSGADFFFPAGAVVLAAYSMLSLLGSVVGATIRRFIGPPARQ